MYNIKNKYLIIYKNRIGAGLCYNFDNINEMKSKYQELLHSVGVSIIGAFQYVDDNITVSILSEFFNYSIYGQLILIYKDNKNINCINIYNTEDVRLEYGKLLQNGTFQIVGLYQKMKLRVNYVA